MATEIKPQLPTSRPQAAAPIPPLENGDRLTREEFERRYDAMPHLKKAELIEGVVHVPSPASKRHSRPQSKIVTWLGFYCSATPGTEDGVNGTVRLDLDNEPQPDVYLLIDPAAGGQTKTSEDEYVESAPELVVEVASSTVSYDLHAKMHVYRRSGVREYLVWRTLDRAVDWFVLEGGEYKRMPSDPSGLLKSRVFPGLWLDPAALLEGDLGRVLAVLGEGIASPEHAEFVKRLEEARRAAGR